MVMILMPDELQSATYKSEIENNIVRGAILAEMEIVEAYSASLKLTILDKKK